MSNPYFKFKQFTVFHDKCAMKVGVDGVTLGAWADVREAKETLDIGCGSGLITLMLAQRCDAKITAIDIDNNSCIQTKENVENSPWSSRIDIVHSSLENFSVNTKKKFDLIVCNPPFFVNSLKSPSDLRTKARHNDTLSHMDLISNSRNLLTKDGRLCVVLPVIEGKQFIEKAEKEGLFCSKKNVVYPNPEKPAKRLLLEFGNEKKQREESRLIIEKERNVYTSEYTFLVKDFYLKL
ncbi:MAG: tRNA1(Val) (adenine(37)-N6)-methyltransferase [Paludibacteraceae bacterium]